MANGIHEQRGLYGTFQQWYQEAKIPAKEVDRDGSGEAKPGEVVAYVLTHLDKFSPKIQKEVDILRQAFRGLGIADAEAVQILTGDLEAGALKLVEIGKGFEKKAAAAKTEKKPEEAARFSKLAEKSYRLALDLRPKTASAHQQLADFLYRSGKTEAGRDQAVHAILATGNEKMPALIGWLNTLSDPEIKKEGAVLFAGRALTQESEFFRVGFLFAWASQEAEKQGDSAKQKLYQEKTLLADQLSGSHSLNIVEETKLRQGQIDEIQKKGLKIQEDLGKVDALLAKGEVVAAEALLIKVEAASEDRFYFHSKMLWEEPNHQLVTSRIDAELKFQRARILELKADGPEKLSDAHWLYVLAESSAGVALSKDPNDATAKATLDKIQKLKLPEFHRAAALKEEQTLQADLARADALLDKGKVEEAQQILHVVAAMAEARCANHGKFFETEDPKFTAGTARIEAELKFQQGRAAELKAKTQPQQLEAQNLYLQAEAAANAVLAKDPKDATALGIQGRLREVREKHQAAALKQEEAIQKDLARVDQLLAKGDTKAAEKLLNKTLATVDARWNSHSKLMGSDTKFLGATARIDAEFKFHQARILDLKADTPAKRMAAQELFAKAEASAGTALTHSKDAATRRIADRIRTFGDQRKDAVLKQDHAIQKELRRVDQLLAKGDTAAATKLLNKTWESVATRWNANFKLLGTNSHFQASTARLDAELKFYQARIMELGAQTQDQAVEAARIYGLAEDSLKLAIEKEPKDPAAFLLRARIRHVRENYKGAVEDYSSALATAPDAATKEGIALQGSFYLQELKNLKAESKRNRELSASMVVVRNPMEQYRALGRELALTQALQADAGRDLSQRELLGIHVDRVLWPDNVVFGPDPGVPDPNLKKDEDRSAKIEEYKRLAGEVGELTKLFENSDLNVALKTYLDETNKLMEKAGLKASDLPASVLNLVEMGPDGKLSFKPEPKTPQGYVDIYAKSEAERRFDALTQIQNTAFIRWNQNQAAATTDPLQKNYYESQALMREDKVPAARLKMMELYAGVKAKLAADPDYFEKNPEVGAMYEQTRKTLVAFSTKALDSLAETNQLMLAQRESMQYVPKATQAKLNQVLINYLRAEIDSGRAVTLDEAMDNLKAEHQRLKASGQAIKINSYNMVSPFTKFAELTPGNPKTVAYLMDEYLGWEKDKSFRLLINSHTRAGLEKSQTRDQEHAYQLQLAKDLRGNSDYPAAAEIFEKLFAKDLEAAKKRITPERMEEIKKEAEEERPKLEKQIREALKKQARMKVSEEDINNAVDQAMAEQKLRGGDSHLPGGADKILDKAIQDKIEKKRTELIDQHVKVALDQAVAAKIDLDIRSAAYGFMPTQTGDHDKIAREAWVQFNDMKDPNDEWDNLADHSWDAIKTEVIVMAVTLPLTLGVGTAVRAGMSGTKLAIRLLNAGRWVRGATQGGILLTGAAAEGFVQTLLTSAIHNRDFEWKEVGFNMVTSMAFHGGNKIWGKFANKLGIGDEAIQAALRSGESAFGKKLGNFAGMMFVQTELSTTFNYLMEKLSGHSGGPGFWSLERHGGEGFRQLGYHGGTWLLNKATRNWAANADMRAKLKAESAHEHYLDLMKTGKHKPAEARKLAAELAHQEIPSVLAGEDPKKIGADLQARKANRLVERMGVDPNSVEGQTLAQIFLLSGDVAKLEKGMGDFKDLDGFVRDRLNIDPTSEHGKTLMKQFARALAHGKNAEALLKEFPELGRMLEVQETAAKQLLEKVGMSKVPGQDGLARELVAIALEKGWSPDDLGKFGEVLAQRPELIRNVVEKIAGDPKSPFSETATGRQLSGLLLVDAMRASPDFDSFAATLMNMEAHANYHMSDINQVALLQGNHSMGAKVALFRWSARQEGKQDWSADLQGILEGRVGFKIKDQSVERVEVSEAEGAGAQKETAKKFAALNDEVLIWANTEHFSADNQKLAMEGMADRVLRTAGYKPGSPEFQAHREFLLKHFESVTRGETNPEDGNWPRVALDLETHLRNGGTMTYTPKGGGQYAIGPAKKARPKAVAVADADTTKVDTPKGGKKPAVQPVQADSQADTTKVETPGKRGGKKVAATPTTSDGESTVAAARSGAADRMKTPLPDATVKGVRGKGTPTPTQPAEGSKTDATPELAGLLHSVDGLDAFSFKPNSDKSVLLGSADKKIPGEAWAVGVTSRSDGGFELVPRNGKIQYEVGGKLVDVPKDGITLKDGMTLKLGDLEFIWKAPNADNASHLATGTRQAGEFLVGELFDYYHSAETRETLKQFAERKDHWGTEAKEFQKDLDRLETLWNDYRALEKDYRKKPTMEQRKVLNKKWDEVQAQGEKLHGSKYHQMERSHARAILEMKSKLAPLEIFLGVEEFASLQQARQLSDKKPDFSFELNFSPPEKIGAYADDFSRVPTKDLVRMDVKVANVERAQELVKNMEGRGEFEIVKGLKFDPDQKSGEMTVLVKNKTVETYTDANGVEQKREVETTQRIVIKFELATVGTGASVMIGNQIREDREQLDWMRAEIRQMKASKQDPVKIADYEKVVAEAEAVFQKTLRNRQYTIDGIPYSEATTAQIGSHNMPEGPGVAGFKSITAVEAKADKIAQAKPSPERIQRYVDYLVKKKKMTQADAEVQAKTWAEQVIVDARAHQAGRTHIYDTSLPMKQETTHLDAATVDHHGRFANPKNSTEQLVDKMEATLETAKKDPAALEAAGKDDAAMAAARRGLNEAGVKKPSEQQIKEIAAAIREMNLKEVTTDNLADGGWSVWIAKNQARIFADPKLRKLVLDATHFEDFTAFGTEYNSKDPGVRLQAALFQKYGAILKDNGIIGSDRFTPAQADKVMGEALAAIDHMVFDPIAREAAATEFFQKVEQGKKVAAEQGLIADASIHKGDTNLSFFDLTKLGDFTVFQQWLALPRVAPAGHPDTIQVSVVPMKPLEITVDAQAKKADRRLQIVAIPNGRELPSQKGLLTAVEAMNQAEVAKAESLGLTPKTGETLKPGQLPRDHFEKLWFGKDNVILPNPMKGGTLLTTGEVSAILSDKAPGSPKLGLFEKPAKAAKPEIRAAATAGRATTAKLDPQGADKAEAAKPADDSGTAVPPLAGVTGVIVGLITLFSPDMAHAATQISAGASGTSTPWIVGAGLMMLGGIAGIFSRRGKPKPADATNPTPAPQHNLPRIPGTDPWATPVTDIPAPLDLNIPSQGPYVVSRGQAGLQDPAISLGHATFSKHNGYWYVLDGTLDNNGVYQPSTNGIHVLDGNGLPVKITAGSWHAIAPGQLIAMGNTWVRFQPAADAPTSPASPPRAPVARSPEILSNFKLGLENKSIDLGVLPPQIKEVDVYVGDPAQFSDPSGFSVLIQDGVHTGVPTPRGKMRREGSNWIYYPVEGSESDLVSGNLVPKDRRADGFIPVENHDYLCIGRGLFQVKGQVIEQLPGSAEVQLHFREGLGEGQSGGARAHPQAERVHPLDPAGSKAAPVDKPVPSDPLAEVKAVLEDNVTNQPRRGTIVQNQATENYGIAAGHTHEGVGKSYNEDAFVQGKDWAVVIDEVGTGGSKGKAGKVFGEAVAKYMAEHRDDANPAEVFKQALLAGGDAINAMPHPFNQASVVAVGHFIVRQPDGSQKAIIVHVGDAVAMVIGKDGTVKHRTRDQSVVEGLVQDAVDRNGVEAAAREFGLNTNDVELMKRAHPWSNRVEGALGGGHNTMPVVTEIPLAAGDRIVMMSDGVSDSVGSKGIVGHTNSAKKPADAMRGIFDSAFSRMSSAYEAYDATRSRIRHWDDLAKGERMEVTHKGQTRYMGRDFNQATASYDYTVYDSPQGGKLVESFSRPVALRIPFTTPEGREVWIDQGSNLWDSRTGGTLLDHYKPSDNITVHVYFHEPAGPSQGGGNKAPGGDSGPVSPGKPTVPPVPTPATMGNWGKKTVRGKVLPVIDPNLIPAVSDAKPMTSQDLLQLSAMPMRDLPKALLNHPEFMPEAKLEVGGRTFYLSRPIISKNSQGTERPYILALTPVHENGQWVLKRRFFYKSDSDGGWRACPYKMSGHLAKGKGEHYTQETQPVPELTAYFEAMEADYTRRPPVRTSSEKLNPFISTDSEMLDKPAMMTMVAGFSHETDQAAVVGMTQVAGIKPGFALGYVRDMWDKKDLRTGKEILQEMANFKYPEGFLPNFQNSPVKTWQEHHQLLGTITCRQYQDSSVIEKGSGRKRPITWTMAEDAQGRVWIESIRFSDAQVNSYGVGNEFLNSGVLTSKPLEYHHQASKMTQEGAADSFNDKYVDLNKALSVLLPIREYRKARGLSDPQLPDNKAAKADKPARAAAKPTIRLSGGTPGVSRLNGEWQVKIPDNGGKPFEIEVGRKTFNDAGDHSQISGKHFRVFRLTQDGNVWIQDMGSSNGTKADRGGKVFYDYQSTEKIPGPPMEVFPGDKIHIGTTVLKVT